jgi:hypothetical protein
VEARLVKKASVMPDQKQPPSRTATQPQSASDAFWAAAEVGGLQLAAEGDFAHMMYGKLPEPWAGGTRNMFVRLPCEQVSGLRVIGHGR